MKDLIFINLILYQYAQTRHLHHKITYSVFKNQTELQNIKIFMTSVQVSVLQHQHVKLQEYVGVHKGHLH